MSDPRILAIMGSGEIAPTMAKVHRALLDRFANGPATAAIIDTPYGFQENADELSARTVEFFETNLGRPAVVASYRSREADAVTLATAIARIHEAGYVMAGPGSPSYALRQWVGGPIPDALAGKLADGGIVTMASAAALTLGLVTIPVYEVYKVGEDPRWLEGLDLLGRTTGLRAAVVPHYDNAEGGTHDTRFCYMGERRLRTLERALPDGAFILGVDGHTALVLDLEQQTATVTGLGGVTVRVAGRSTILRSGGSVAIGALAEAARDLATGSAVHIEAPSAGDAGGGTGVAGGLPARRPLRDAMADREGTFIHALDAGDTRAAVAALLDLEDAITGRMRAGEDSPDLDSADATFRSLIARLGDRVGAGQVDMRSVVEPYVATLLELRAAARKERDWATSDLIRDRLAAADVEVQDHETESTWVLHEVAKA